ncbi:hypothetical protein K2X30_14385 [bacterium]|nr:hypothetical protein [bacterium]
MKIRKNVSAFVFTLAVFLAAPTAMADQVYVESATGSDVNASELKTTVELIRTSVPEVGSHGLVESAGSADYSLRPKLIRLGESFVLSLAKVKDGKVVFSSQLKAAKIEELDKVAQRLTRSVISEIRATNDSRVGEVTDHESRDGTQRKATRKVTYVGFGGSVLSSLNTSGVAYSLAGAYGWDVNQMLISLLLQVNFKDTAQFLGAGLEAQYFLSMDGVAPYVSGFFGAGGAKVHDTILSGEMVGGFMAGVGGGVTVLRTSNVNLDLGFRANFLLRNNAFGLPQAYSLRVGVVF